LWNSEGPNEMSLYSPSQNLHDILDTDKRRKLYEDIGCIGFSIAWVDLMIPRTKPVKSKARRNRLGKSSFLTDSCISVKNENLGPLSFHESVFEISEITGRF